MQKRSAAAGERTPLRDLGVTGTRARGFRVLRWSPSKRDALGVHAGPCQRAYTAPSREVERLQPLEPASQSERQPGAKAVAGAVRIDGSWWKWRG